MHLVTERPVRPIETASKASASEVRQKVTPAAGGADRPPSQGPANRSLPLSSYGVTEWKTVLNMHRGHTACGPAEGGKDGKIKN